MFPFCRLFLIVVALTFHASAQRAFLAGDEIPISGASLCSMATTSGHEVYPCIAVSDDGAVWLTWPGGMQWLTPALQFDGSVYPCASHQAATALHDDQWAKAEDSLTIFDSGNTRDFFLRTYRNKIPGARSDIVYQGRWFRDMSWDPYEIDMEALAYLQCMSNSSVSFLIGMSSKEYNVVGLFDADVRFFLDFWNHRDVSLNPIHATVVKISSVDTVRLLPNAVGSPVRNGCFGYYERQAMRDYANGGRYVFPRSMTLYDLNGATIGPSAVLDTLYENEVDYSERLVLGRWKDAFVLRLDSARKGVMVEHFSQDGALISRSSLGISNVRLHKRTIEPLTLKSPLDMDLEIVQLPRDQYIAGWSESAADGTSDVLVALFDSTMTMVGAPKRLNADVAGNQFEVRLAVKGDTVYAVWLAVPDGHGGTPSSAVTFRAFTADRVLDVAPVAAPAACGVAVYPAPVRDHLTIVTHDTRSPATAQILDLLGRVVRSVAVTRGATSTSCGDLAPGVYQIRLTNAGSIGIATFVVVR